MDARYILAVLASDEQRVEFLASSILGNKKTRIDQVLMDGYFSGWEVPAIMSETSPVMDNRHGGTEWIAAPNAGCLLRTRW